MLSYLKEISYIRLIIPFILGIVGSVFLPFEINISLMLLGGFLFYVLFMIIHLNKPIQRKYRLRWVNGALIYLIFFLTGYMLCQSRTQINDEEHFSHLVTDESLLVVQVDQPLAEKDKSLKTIAKVKYVITGDDKRKTIGKLLIYFKKDSSAANIKYGDLLLVSNRINHLPEPQNPHEFDYKLFMSFRQIYNQCYLTPEDWISLGINQGNRVLAKILNLRAHLFKTLTAHVHDENSLAVASSLLLGLRENLDDEVIKAYSSSGAMHVLAVSGLHVGILYIIINYLLFFLNANARIKVFKSILIILIIWLYACLTGLSPSVQRASVMFTFVAIGQNIKRTTNIYNVLAGSAFLLLIINPFLIMEVGFQLSYAAIIGIVMFQPHIYNLVYVPNWLLDKLWMIIAVSIAAQIATFPIGLLYFHQFPVYFFISNLFVIPAATIILYLGISLFALSWVEFLGEIIGWLLNFTISTLNSVIFFIEELPYSLLQGLTISILEAWLIYIAIGATIAFVYLKRPSFVFASLASLTLFFILILTERYTQLNQQKLIVYNVPRHSAIDFIKGSENLFVTDDLLLSNRSKMLFHIKHNWWESGIKRIKTSNDLASGSGIIHTYKNYVQFHNKRILVLQEPLKKIEPAEKLKVDYIILSKSPKVKIEDLAAQYDFKQIIFDSSNSRWRTKYWKQDCEELKVAYHDVGEKGAFILNI